MAGAATTQPVSTVISMGVLFFLSYGILEISVLGIYLSLFKRVLLSRPQSKLCRVTNSFCFTSLYYHAITFGGLSPYKQKLWSSESLLLIGLVHYLSQTQWTTNQSSYNGLKKGKEHWNRDNTVMNIRCLKKRVVNARYARYAMMVTVHRNDWKLALE